MTRKAKIILGVALSAVLLGCVVIALGIWSLLSFLQNSGTAMNEEIPADLLEPRILKGEDFLVKQEIFKKIPLSASEVIIKAVSISDEEARRQFTEAETAKRFWGFSDLRVCGDDIVAVGRFGGYRLDSAGAIKGTLSFEPRVDQIKIFFWNQKNARQTLDDLRILDVEGDGQCEFISRNPLDGVAFFDAKGRTVWRYGERRLEDVLSSGNNDNEASVTGVDFGDVDDDGKLDVLISRRADGIRAFTADKREIWFQPDELTLADFRFIDTDGDGKQELVQLDGLRSLVREKLSGKILYELKLGTGTEGIFEGSDRNQKGTVQICEIKQNKLLVKDLSAKVLYESDAPLSEVRRSGKTGEPIGTPDAGESDAPSGMRSEPVGDPYTSDTESIYEPKYQLVRMHAGKPKYLVVLASFIGIPRTNLYVYGPDGRFLYHELLGEEAEALSVKPNPDGTEGFIVGGKDTVWKYAAR